MARIWLAALVDIATGTAFPVGILSVNVLGSFAIGLAAARLTGPRDANRSTQCRHFFMTGFCGGFTTFSFFSLQTLHLLETGRPLMALLYSVSTLGLAIAAVWLGHRLGR